MAVDALGGMALGGKRVCPASCVDRQGCSNEEAPLPIDTLSDDPTIRCEMIGT